MNSKKAREIIDLNVKQRSPSMPLDVLDALKLSIEAHDLLAWIRQGHIPAPDFLLPSEARE